MKEAAGEANMTIVTIVLIAIVLGAGTLIVTNIVNSMKNNNQTKCSEAGGTWSNNVCRCDETKTLSADQIKSGSKCYE